MAIINPDQITDIVEGINACPNCTQVEAYAGKQLGAWVKQMEDLIKAQASASAKMVPPTDLGEVISWISTLVGEAAADHAKITLLIAEVVTAYATITAAITSKIAGLSCEMPEIPELPTP